MLFYKWIFSFALIATIGLFSPELYAQTKAVGASGLPLLRFAYLQSDEINMRTGPGIRYPIEWVYKKESLPVEITAEFDIWRRVRDFEGSEGWLHKSTLSGRRTVIVINEGAKLFKSDTLTSSPLATIDTGVIGRIESCNKKWCNLLFGDYDGYMQKSDFWGVYSHEVIDD